jgi:hypothetical protein
MHYACDVAFVAFLLQTSCLKLDYHAMIVPKLIVYCPFLLLQAVTIATLAALDEWSITTDIWLTCEIEETFYTR